MAKGLLVYVYRADGDDFSLGGVTAVHDKLILVGKDIPEIFESSEYIPAVKLVKRNLVGTKIRLHAEPVENKRGKHFMAGGNFIYTPDGRFPNDYPIPVWDRQE